MMVVGFDVHHGVKGSGSQAVGAMVSTTTGTFASYFSTVSFHSSGDELARLMVADLISKFHFFEIIIIVLVKM